MGSTLPAAPGGTGGDTVLMALSLTLWRAGFVHPLSSPRLWFCALCLCCSFQSFAEVDADLAGASGAGAAELTVGDPAAAVAAAAAAGADNGNRTLSTLRSLVALQTDLETEVLKLTQQMEASASSVEKQNLLDRITALDTDLKSTRRTLQEVAAGADLAQLREEPENDFDFQRELFSLLEPAIKEMKEMTSHVRQKTELRDKINYFSGKIPTSESAVENIQTLLEVTEAPAVKGELESMLANWNKQLKFLQTERQSAELQLAKIEAQEVSLAEASQGYLKTFFRKRGLYLGQALLVVLGLLLISRYSYRLMVRYIKGYQKPQRSFRIRVLDLSHRVLTVLSMIIGPMVVFYLAEDWLLFSIGLLLLIGIGLTLRHALPRYMKQIQLFLNVGTVREGERIDIDGLPWLVRQINVFTMLENPAVGFTRRMKIDDLVDLRSRPQKKGEPWFPCKIGDWVLLGDGKRGKLIGASQELVQFVQRGGNYLTYQTTEFVAQSVMNLSTNFRLKETIGITYNLQSQSVKAIPQQLKAYIEERLIEEELADYVLNCAVEFEYANSSSLDLVMIIDFKGEVAQFYNRYRRAMQRWAVEACTKHNWEIPFSQVVVHPSVGQGTG